MPQFSTIAANSVESAEFGARGSVVFCPSLPSPLPFFLLPFFFPFFLSPFCCVFPHYSPLPLFAVFGLSRLGVPTVLTGGTPGSCCKYLCPFCRVYSPCSFAGKFPFLDGVGPRMSKTQAAATYKTEGEDEVAEEAQQDRSRHAH